MRVSKTKEPVSPFEKTMPTVSEILLRTKYRPSGFDYMRIVLSTMVIVSHSFLFCYGLDTFYAVWDGPAKIVFKPIVPMFFCLSGFLVSGSMERCRTLVSFIGLRIIRIYPALAVEVLLSAFLVGPLVSTLPLNEYFSGQEFALYMLNIIGDIHYKLPGIFNGNPLPSIVNSQLWTVPFELMCYVAISAIILLRHFDKGRLIIFVLISFGFVYFYYKLSFHKTFFLRGAVSGSLLIPYFLSGVLYYHYRYTMPINGYIAIVAGVLSVLLLAYVPGGDFLACISLGYFTIYIGLLNPRRLFFVKHADISYGVYLYGAVIQQLLVYEFPSARSWYLNVALALPISIVLSFFSWHCVEKPAQNLRFLAKALEERWLASRWLALRAPISRLGAE